MIFLNNKQVVVKKFPNGESLIETSDFELRDENEIMLKFQDDSDIASLLFLKGYIDDNNKRASLTIPYMPYSRMDRTEGLTVFTLKYLCKLINSMNFQSVTIYEPHSDVSVALLDRVKVVNMSAIIAKDVINNLKQDNLYIVYPDAGAEKRYTKQIKYDKILTCSKERDFKTGLIKKLEINGTVSEKTFDAIIIDDLCSKGGTFTLTAEKLKKMGANNIYLVVTHCEDNIFKGEILNTDIINRIYTTNSIISKEHEKIQIRNIF